MSQEHPQGHADYPENYITTITSGESIEARARTAQQRYSQRLQEQLQELTSENLPSTLSEDDRNEILSEALFEVVKACQVVATNSGLAEGKIVAELIEKTLHAGSLIENFPEPR